MQGEVFFPLTSPYHRCRVNKKESPLPSLLLIWSRGLSKSGIAAAALTPFGIGCGETPAVDALRAQAFYVKGAVTLLQMF